MSYDELPPDSDALPTEVEATETAPETSPSDAPPAAPRRRSVRAAGAAAASAPETAPTEKPAPRRRKAKTDAEAPAIEAKAEPEPPAPAPKARRTAKAKATVEAPPEPAALEKPTRRRATPKKAETPEVSAEIAPPSVTPEPETPSVIASETAQTEKPSRRRNPRSAKKTNPPATEASEMISSETSAATAPDETPTETLIAPVPPYVAIEVSPAPSIALAAPLSSDGSVNNAATAEISDAAPAAEPAADDRLRRQRRPRRRREPADKTADSAAPTADDSAVLDAAPDSAAETETDASPETDDAPGSARSRRRRSGRTRREKPETAPTDAPAIPAAVLSPRLDAARVLDTPPPIPVVVPREPPIDTSVGTHLIKRNGLPEITINSVTYPPVLFFGNMEEEASRPKVVSEVKRAAANGAHLHSVLVELPCPLSESNDALDRFDNRVRALLDADPDGFVMPRIVFLPAKGWKREYPNDIASYADGTSADPSLTSERFWAEAERSLVTLIGHVREHEWGKRVFGYHLERGEWFQPLDSGYDRSAANRDAFRDWLREKYKHDLVGIRAAWYDGEVQFHTAEIPPLPTKPNPQKAFFETRRERCYIDFNEFTSESTAKRLTELAKAAKKAANHQALVSVSYGYTFEFGHGYSGHLALETLLDSPHIDLLCGPPSYRDRKPGGAASLPAPVESVLLHGKLWISEDDTKTYLAPAEQDPEDFNPRLADRFATEQAQSGAMGQVLTRNIGIAWMDLWGEGWLDEDAMWERIGAFTANLKTARSRQNGLRVPEVVALIDEKSLLHLQRGEPFFRKITNGLRETLQKTGVSFGTYLQSDLLRDDFPLTAKLYLFLTPYRLTGPIRTAIQEKLQSGGKTLAFLFAPGSCEARPALSGAMEETAGGSVGLILRQQEWNSEIGSRVIEPNHPLTERLVGREIGTRERINPSFFVDDPDATTLAEYQGSGLPSISVRDFGKWKSVFVGEPALPLEMLRGICRYAGVNVWLSGDDVFSAGNGWAMLRSSRDGQKTLRLPGSVALYDLTENRLISENIREHRFFMKSGATRLFYVGDIGSMRELGLPNLPEPGAFRFNRSQENSANNAPEPPAESLSLPNAQRIETQTETAPPPAAMKISPPVPLLERALEPEREAPSLRADLATLEAVLNLDVSELDLDLEEGIEAPTPRPVVTGGILPLSIFGEESEADAKRRRRRGGRGRGRKRFGSISEDKEDGEEAANGASAPSAPAETNDGEADDGAE